ncbi:MAG: peptide chain release factor 1 [Clostridiales bacterium]|nr:peptide chain release factor 1 [Clostridiales bacterium]
MIERLKKIKERFEELTKDLMNPDVLADMNIWQKKSKEQADLSPIVEKFDEYLRVEGDMKDAEELLKTEKDPDMVAMLNDEFYEGKEKLKKVEEELKILLLPKDENDEGNVIVEIRAGVGGDEAGIFAGDLYRMYTMFADRNRFKVEVLDEESAEGGIIKQVNFMVTGKGAYAKFKYESGVHRVQRVPVTESSGRIHTSAATVAVLPEAKDVKIEINEKDLQIDYYRAGGAGGQHVNKTESAIRITHLPTGIIVACQDERSQGKNKEKAMNWLKSKLYDFYQSQEDSEYAEKRKSQVGTGDRSEKIRTYNYPQSRVTDHRINMTIYSLENFMNGDIGDMVEALTLADQQAKLSQIEE